MKNREKDLLQNWLDKLQQESWQLELLISGFAIFGLFGLKDYMLRIMEQFFANSHGDYTLRITYGMMVMVFVVTQVFIVNLLIHVLIRGLWIGAIGLRYVSGDIDYEQLKYNERFLKYYNRTVGSFDKYIVGLEKISSVIFSFTFLLFFVFLSLFLFFTMTGLISMLIVKFDQGSNEKLLLIINIFWLGLFGLVAFDFITLGLIKRIKQRHFAIFYLGLYKIVGVLTLSFLWRPLLLNFLDQKYTKRLLIAIVPYSFLILVIFPNGGVNQFEYFLPFRETPMSGDLGMTSRILNEHEFNSKFYDSLRDKDKLDFKLIRSISLPSYKIKGPLLEVFVRYTMGTENYLTHKDSTLIKMGKIGYYNGAFGSGDYSAYTKKEKKKIFKEILAQADENLNPKSKKMIKDSLRNVFKNASKVAYAKNILKIKQIIKEEMTFLIDSQPIADSLISLDFFIHPNAGEKGMLCFVPIDLTLGRHTFSYHKKYIHNPKTNKIDTFKVTIPFIYLGD